METNETNRKVLFFLPSGVSGAERMTITIAKMLDVKKFEVIFVVIGKQLGNTVEFIPSCYPVKLIKIRNIYDFVVLRLFRYICKEKPDVVFCSLLYLNSRVISAAKLYGKTKIVVRSSNGLNILGKITRKLCGITYPKADVVIAQQEEMREELLNSFKLKPEKVITLHNPIDTDNIDGKANEPSPFNEDNVVRYVWVGRVAKTKGQDILIKSFAKVHSKIVNSRLYFIGKYDEQGCYYLSLLSLIRELGIENVVHFVGFDSNPYRWIKYANSFVMPSRVEGLPNALIEAMYLGVPVVATRCIPIVDRIVENGYNGYVVNPNCPEEMADAMVKSLDLKDFVMTYKGASDEDFKRLFEV